MEIISRTYRAGAAIAAGLCVKRDANNAAGEPVAIPADDGTILTGDPILGICEPGAASGALASVTRHGPAKAIAGGVLTPGTHHYLKTDANGKLVAATLGTDLVIATLEGKVAAVADDVIDVIVINCG